MTPAPTLAMKSRARRALRAALVAVCVVMPAALFVYTSRHHEFWRDEVQALLIGRDVPLSGLLHAMRLEGTPPLFHLLLKLLCLVVSAPTALAVAGAVGYATLLAGTFHLLRVLSRRPTVSLLLTVALGCTHTFIYELGVISRPYGVGLGLDLAGIGELHVALRLGRCDRALRGAILCGVAAITSDHAACVAGAALASFALCAIAERRSIRPALPTLASLPFFALTWYLMAPFAERTAEAAAPINPHLGGALVGAARLLRSGALPGGWWSELSGAVKPDQAVFALFTAAVVLVACLRLSTSRRALTTTLFPFGLVLLSWGTLLYIFIAWYPGGYRHHLFLWMPAVVYTLGWLADARFEPGRARLAPAVGLLLLLPWLRLQYRIAWDDLRADLDDDFSQTKQTAAMLPPGARVVSDRDYTILSLRLWRDDVSLKSPDGQGRELGHIVVDRLWHDRLLLGPMILSACRAAPDRVFVARHHVPRSRIGACYKMFQPSDGLLLSEQFDLYRINCPCLLALP